MRSISLTHTLHVFVLRFLHSSPLLQVSLFLVLFRVKLSWRLSSFKVSSTSSVQMQEKRSHPHQIRESQMILVLSVDCISLSSTATAVFAFFPSLASSSILYLLSSSVFSSSSSSRRCPRRCSAPRWCRELLRLWRYRSPNPSASRCKSAAGSPAILRTTAHWRDAAWSPDRSGGLQKNKGAVAVARARSYCKYPRIMHTFFNQNLNIKIGGAHYMWVHL